jgi:hypothetical protein
MPFPEPIAAGGKPSSEPLAVMLRREAAFQVLHIVSFATRSMAYGDSNIPGPGSTVAARVGAVALAAGPSWMETDAVSSSGRRSGLCISVNRRNGEQNRLDRILQRKVGLQNRQIAGWCRDDVVSGRTVLDLRRRSRPGIAVTMFGIERAGF